jgi:hypothetical protein
MSVLLPVMLTAAHLALTAQEVPKLNIEPSCQAAAVGLIRQDTHNGARNANACIRDERRARAKLKPQWNTFSSAERARCRQLIRLGGPPSYVELLTCLQTAKAARNFAGGGALDGGVAR